VLRRRPDGRKIGLLPLLNGAVPPGRSDGFRTAVADRVPCIGGFFAARERKDATVTGPRDGTAGDSGLGRRENGRIPSVPVGTFLAVRAGNGWRPVANPLPRQPAALERSGPRGREAIVAPQVTGPGARDLDVENTVAPERRTAAPGTWERRKADPCTARASE